MAFQYTLMLLVGSMAPQPELVCDDFQRTCKPAEFSTLPECLAAAEGRAWAIWSPLPNTYTGHLWAMHRNSNDTFPLGSVGFGCTAKQADTK
jgi:hypothetical protein